MTTNEQSAETLAIKLAERIPKGPILAAGRFISCFGKPLKRNYGFSVSQQEKTSILKRISSTRHRSTSPFSQMKNSTTTPSNLNQMSKTVLTSNAPSTPTPDTIGVEFNYRSTYEQLRSLAETNVKYFSQQQTDVCQRFERLLSHLIESLDSTCPIIDFLIENFHHFDYSPEVKMFLSNENIRFYFCLDPSQRLSNVSHRSWPSRISNSGNSSSTRYKTCWTSF